MSTTRWWLAVPLALGLVVVACGGDADSGNDSDASIAPASTAAAAPEPTTDEPDDVGTNEGAGASSGTMTLGDEEIAFVKVSCFFEEQPRAGLGGVFTHTLQASAVNAAGDDVLLDLTRARAEDGTVDDDVIVDIGDFRSEDAVSLRGGGPEGLIQFGDDSASATDVEVTDFETDPVSLSFDASCS